MAQMMKMTEWAKVREIVEVGEARVVHRLDSNQPHSAYDAVVYCVSTARLWTKDAHEYLDG